MAKLEEIRNGASVRGIASSQATQIVSVDWIGDQAINVVYRDVNGAVAESVLYRDDEHRLHVEVNGRPWSFDGDGALLRLVTEANRIKLAHYFDPYLAIHTSLVDPLPHQISAVYGEMLPRQPLRFLLADDPGAGKTIMAGLLIKELIARSDLERCLIVAPGSLVEQWQDELGQKFNLEFDILTRDMIETSRSGNPFEDRHRLIVRLDVLARNEELQHKLASAREGAKAYAEAVAVYLGFLTGQLANHCSTICGWNAPNQQMRSTFARQAKSRNNLRWVTFERKEYELRKADAFKPFLARFLQGGCYAYVGGKQIDTEKEIRSIEPHPFIYISSTAALKIFNDMRQGRMSNKQ